LSQRITNHFALYAVFGAFSTFKYYLLNHCLYELANYTTIMPHKLTPEPTVTQLEKKATIEMRVNLLQPKIYTGYISGKFADFPKFTPHLKC
jgi:hypothetical protein